MEGLTSEYLSSSGDLVAKETFGDISCWECNLHQFISIYHILIIFRWFLGNLAWSPVQNMVAAGSWDNSVYVWEVTEALVARASYALEAGLV